MTKKESKQYSLKDIDFSLLEAMQTAHQAAIFNILNFIAVDRFAYSVSSNTEFSIDPKQKTLTISEKEEVEDKPNEPIAT